MTGGASWAGVALLLLAGPAAAVEGTETPPRLKGDVGFSWSGRVDFVELADRVDESLAYERVGASVRQRHDVAVSGAFTVYPGIAIRLELPATAFDRTYWVAARGFRYEPDGGGPTLVSGPRIDPEGLEGAPSSRVHAGLSGLAMGVRLVPFAPGGPFGDIGPAQLAVDLGFRTPGDGHHDRVRASGTAGGAEGGAGLSARLTGARRIGAVEPWVSIEWRGELPYRTPLIDADGREIVEADGRGVRLDPADELELSAGAEMIAREASDDTMARVGISALAIWRSPDEISAGTRLPQPQRAAIGHVAVSGEHLRVGGRLSFRVRPLALAEARFHLGGGWVSPHRLEQITDRAYSVQSGSGTFWADLRFAMVFRIR